MGEAARKVIPLPLERSGKRLGTDELNICEFPLSVFGRVTGDAPKTLTFEDDIFDEGSGRQVHRRLVVSASDAFGLPTPSDTDVLLVLMHLTTERNAFTEQTVKFTRYELVKLLGWDGGGKSYRRLEEALNRWASVTLYYNHAWWDKTGKAWRSRTFHVLESVDLRGRENGGDDSLSSFSWNDVLFKSFRANHLRKIDLDEYFSLSSPAARQAYRFLGKRFYRSNRLTFDLRAFACEHVGFSRGYDNGQLKRKLRRALKELEAIGFLKPASDKERYCKETRGKWNITLVRERENESDKVLPAESLAESLISELINRGVSAPVAGKLTREIVPEKIKEKIAFHDWLLLQDKVRHPTNPGGYLASSIRDDWALPRKFGKKDVRETNSSTQPANDERESENERAETRRAAEFKRFWKTLGESKQQELEKKATANMARLQADTFQRLEEKGGRLFEQMRLTIIQSYADRQSLF